MFMFIDVKYQIYIVIESDVGMLFTAKNSNIWAVTRVDLGSLKLGVKESTS